MFAGQLGTIQSTIAQAVHALDFELLSFYWSDWLQGLVQKTAIFAESSFSRVEVSKIEIRRLPVEIIPGQVEHYSGVCRKVFGFRLESCSHHSRNPQELPAKAGKFFGG
jgi:hypothetical protein